MNTDKNIIDSKFADPQPESETPNQAEKTNPKTASADPLKGAWKQVAFLSDFPGARTTMAAVSSGGVWDMKAFNGWLYAFIGSYYTGASDDGFMVYKGKPVPEGTEGRNAAGWLWIPIVSTVGDGRYPNGVGNPCNIAPTPFPYSVGGKDYMYVGTCADLPTAIVKATSGGTIMDVLDALYPIQLYRFDADDNWEMIIGYPEDSNGVFSSRLGNYGAGFFNPPENLPDLPIEISSPRELSLNVYQWRMGVYKDKLYVTTMDANMLLDYAKNFASTEDQRLLIEILIESFRTYNTNPLGFDLYSTGDGINFSPVTTNGFGDKYNYGGRTVKATDNGIFIGTANPFYGCQVWKINDIGSSGGSGGGGCNTGFAAIALLLLMPLLVFRKKQ